ncbi:MAG: hypothetical protein R3F11_10595 [Verrucomicrobiales bacterium]
MPGKNWTDAELASLQNQWETKQDPAAIKIRGRSRHGIKRKLLREGLLEPSEPPREVWTDWEEDTLKEQAAQGMTARQIVQQSGMQRSLDSVAQKMRRLGLARDRSGSRAIRETRKLKGADRDEFLEALQEHAEARPTSWFVWKFGVGRGQVKRALKELGIEVSWKDAMKMPQTRSRFLAHLSVGSAEAWNRRRQSLRKDLVALKRQLDDELAADPKLAKRKKFELRRCPSCQAEWYARDDFFAPYTTRKNGEKRRYLHRVCRLCPPLSRQRKNSERMREYYAREKERKKLAEFFQQLAYSFPAVFSNVNSGSPPSVHRWKPYHRTMVGLEPDERQRLAAGVLTMFVRSGISPILNRLEGELFGGEPELHTDAWELDDILREKGSEDLGAIAIRLYRVLRLPEYAMGLL